MTWKPVSEELVKETLELILNVQNHPLMIMDSSGLNETGTVVGCLRRIQGWNLSSIIEEYRRFAGSKAKNVNELFIELFDTDLVTLPEPGNIPEWYSVSVGMCKEEIYSKSGKHQRPSKLQKLYFDVHKAPLISDKVKYDKKKSICNDED